MTLAMKRIIGGFLLVFVGVALCTARGDDRTAAKASVGKRLVVHEWGTFTTLQDEGGNSVSGINTDDEPAPDFVHRLATQFFLDRTEMPPNFFQGAPACHPDVTMRLETPVLYFYKPKGWEGHAVDVQVKFRNGWLTEFYPKADFAAPGFDAAHPGEVYTETSPAVTDWRGGFGRIKDGTWGELSWRGISLEGAGDGPATTEKVWLAPREVESTPLRVAGGESEKFLFYRGVAHNDAPLRIVRSKGQLEIHDSTWRDKQEEGRIDAAWLVDVQGDGVCAYDALGALEEGKEIRRRAPAEFARGAYAPKNMAALRGEMKAALVKEGLFKDEADALLNTWQVSYFKSPGLRLFYICPRIEVNGLLPLEVSDGADVTRVMMGRIELVTPGQRALLAKIAAGPAPKLESIPGFPSTYYASHPEVDSQTIHNVEGLYRQVMEGKRPMIALGIPIPEVYADFLKLGRFRVALLIDEEKKRPTAALKDFIRNGGFMDEDFFAQIYSRPQQPPHPGEPQ